MQLSVAIREGSKMRAASEKGWNDTGPDGEVRTCPLLAAAEAYGLMVIREGNISPGPKWIEPTAKTSPDRGGMTAVPFSWIPDEWFPVWMFVDASPCSCEKHGTPASICDIATHLYDVHRWSREEVADWVEKVEMKVDHKQWVAAKGPDKPWTPGVKW